MASASIYGIMIGKFRHKKKPCLIILIKVDSSLKLGFHYAILSLGLALYLWIKGIGEFLLDA